MTMRRLMTWLFGAFLLLLREDAFALGLLDGYHLALENDPQFQAAIQEHEAGRQYRALGRAALLPRLVYSYNRGRSWSDVTQATTRGDFKEDRDYDSYVSTLSLQQPLFDYEAFSRYRKGVAQALDAPGHLITSRLEHKAVLDTVQQLADDGWSVTWLAPGTDGLIRPEQVEAAWRADTRLVSLMRVNNELGTLTDIAAIGERVRERGALFHVDAAQASGKVAIDLGRLAVDLMSFSAHKTYGPKGIGALYVGPRAERRLKAQIHGGGHEQGLRSGTLATHQIVGMGEAFALAGELFEEEGRRIAGLQRRLLEGLAQIDGWRLNGSADARIAHTLNLTFDNPAFVPQALESSLAVSSTSACNSARPAPSHVLLALGHDAASAGRSVRLSLGRYTREADVDAAVAALKAAADSGAPAWQPFLGVSRAG